MKAEPPEELDRATNTTEKLDQSIVRGSAWLALTFGGRTFLALGSTAVAARFVTPAEFGSVALALTLVLAIEQIQEGGLGAALIYADDASERVVNTVTAYYCVVALASVVILAFSGSLLAGVFGSPGLELILPAVALAGAARVMAVVPTSLLERRLAYREQGLVELMSGGVQAALVVGLAVAGLGAWALVLGQVSGAVCLALAMWCAVRARPRIAGASMGVYRSLRTYGRHVMLTNIFNVTAATADNLIVGRFAGMTALGLYGQSFRLASLPATTFGFVVGRTMLPAYSRLKGQPDGVSRLFLMNVERNLLVIAPVVAVMLFAAGPLLVVFLGPRWAEGSEVLSTLAIYGFVRGYSGPCGELFKGVGRPNLGARYGALFVLLMVPSLILLTSAWGASGAALAMAGTMVLVGNVQIWHALRACGVSVFQGLAYLWRALACCVIVFASTSALVAAAPSDLSPLSALAGAVAAAGVSWALAVRLLSWGAVLEVRSSFRGEDAEL